MYSRAVADPKKELVHLYDVRDALSQHYRNGKSARKVLSISRDDWARLGYLANNAPIRQGRHAGEHHENLRNATDAELAEARNVVKQWITAFAYTV